MDTKSEKVYVAVGNDLQEGIGTLEWALRKWSGQTISIVIIHFNNNNKDFVYTPFGKLPASSVNDEKLRIFRMYEQEKTDKLLSKYIDFCAKNASDRIGAMRAKTEEARKMTEEKRKEVKIHVERQRRAERIISLCNRRVEELDARINEESTTQNDLKKDLEAAREYIYEVSSDIEETKSKLSSIMELQAELTRKLHSSSLAKFHAESQLQNAMAARTEMLLEIDELRRERDLLRRRVEFCREKEAIAAATASSNSLNYAYREFTADEIRVATDDFSERMRLKSGGVGTNVYRGRLNHTTVAIKLQDSLCRQSQEEFRTKMELLCKIRHPHLISMIGACTERRCIILEYMHNGSLQDILFFSSNSKSNRSRNRTLPWHARIRIAAEICSGLSFLHMAEPRSIVHGDLNPSKVLLDRHLVAKLAGFRLGRSSEESEKRSDAHAFGIIMLQLLTGRQGAGLVEEVTRAMKCGALIGVLDETTAREWPLELAEEFAGIALRCVDVGGKQRMETRRATVMRELEELKRKASDVKGWRGSQTTEGGLDQEDDRDVPSVFLCPILQEVMKNPHVAADGFSYEWEAIEEWLRTGHETSPMTNLRLNHKLLTPNHTLRSLIHDWLN
uniref:RING-type E3 ubiquitin transferase n=1 Tax=Nelumbo nucifera TaxID=4432 RepID=A0A822Z789_NELNU|nr:TPA_asm: hypothetical protein HUJ06_015255 [Nelumbo nucifera]